MNRRTWLTLLIVTLLIGGVSGACKKDTPEPPAPAPPVVEPDTAEDVEPDVEPEVADETPSPLDAGVIAANSYARDNGLIGDIYFDFDRSDLSSSARDRLAQNAEFMTGHPQFTFTIEGHCDERGTNEYNLALGDRRANAALSYLVSLGVDAGRITTISYGEENPACMTSGESCWSQNRRAAFAITGER